MSHQILNGDCREVMQGLADCSVDAVVTDPPYELGFMGKSWDRSGIAYRVEVWIEALRVLKPGGHLLAFGGSRTYHRLACAIEDAGFEIRDQIQWLYGSGFPKSLDVSKAIDAAAGAERETGKNGGAGPFANTGRCDKCGKAYFSGSACSCPRLDLMPATDTAKQWAGWGTALKPAHEPIVLARKSIVGTVAENVLKYGTGGLNIDGCRIEAAQGDYDHSGNNLEHTRRGRPDWRMPDQQAPPNALGRWPANVIHDGSEDVTRLFPINNANGYRVNPSVVDLSDAVIGYSGDAIRGERGHDDTGSAARFFYCAKASKEDRDEGLESLPIRSAGEVTDRQDGSDGLNSPRAGAGRTNGSRNHHPTVKPTDLMRYLCRLVTPPNGTVLDPFCGSGSTGKAAVLERFNFIGIELSAEYCELAEKRIEAVTRQGLLSFEVA